MANDEYSWRFPQFLFAECDTDFTCTVSYPLLKSQVFPALVCFCDARGKEKREKVRRQEPRIDLEVYKPGKGRLQVTKSGKEPSTLARA